MYVSFFFLSEALDNMSPPLRRSFAADLRGLARDLGFATYIQCTITTVCYSAITVYYTTLVQQYTILVYNNYYTTVYCYYSCNYNYNINASILDHTMT